MSEQVRGQPCPDCGAPDDQKLADGSLRCGPCYYKARWAARQKEPPMTRAEKIEAAARRVLGRFELMDTDLTEPMLALRAALSEEAAKESAEDVRRRLGSAPLAREEQDRNLDHNLRALSEEEGTPARCPACEHYDGTHSPLCPSPATPSEDACPECNGKRCKINGAGPYTRMNYPCPRCGGSGRATPRGDR